MTARLTVIVACHDLADVIPTTLASLERAIDDRVELLFVDDQSSDATPDLIRAALPRLGRARVHTPDRNLGLAGVRNLGLRMAETDYVTFLDGDDWVSRGWYPTLLGALVAARCDFVRTDHVEADGRGRLLRRVPDGHRDGRIGSPRDAILPVGQRTAVDVPYAWAGAYHRSLADAGLLDFPDLRTAEDRPWIWRLFLGADSFTVPRGAGVHYRLDRAGSLTKLATSTQLEFVRSMELTLDVVRADRDADRFLPKAVRRYLELTLHHLGRLDRFPPEVAATFRGLLAASLGSTPEVADVLPTLPPASRERLTRLIAKEAS
ncbi:glycosyltransferase family 2 protein [Mariniluteicoccus flavus]